MKLPAYMFYTGDWMKDPAVRSVGYAARGLWKDMLCLMHESPRRGYLQYENGKPVTTEQLARMTGGSLDEASRLLLELESSGVFSRTEHGVIYCRRMVKDDQARKKQSEFGKLGGNPTLKGGLNPPLKAKSRHPLTPVSVSSSISKEIKNTPQPPKGGSAPTGPGDVDSSKPYVLRKEPECQLVYAYKQLEVSLDNRDWDREHFARARKRCLELLGRFGGDLGMAMKCLTELAADFKQKRLSFTLETVLAYQPKWREQQRKKTVRDSVSDAAREQLKAQEAELKKVQEETERIYRTDLAALRALPEIDQERIKSTAEAKFVGNIYIKRSALALELEMVEIFRRERDVVAV